MNTKQYKNAVADLGCLACCDMGYSDTPAALHHIRSGVGKGQRASDWEIIPLCGHHHQTGSYGEAYHAGPKVWQDRFGNELALVARVWELIGIQPERDQLVSSHWDKWSRLWENT